MHRLIILSSNQSTRIEEQPAKHNEAYAYLLSAFERPQRCDLANEDQLLSGLSSPQFVHA